MEDIKKPRLYRKNRINEHMNPQGLWKHIQGLYRSKLGGISALRWEMDTCSTPNPEAISNWKPLTHTQKKKNRFFSNGLSLVYKQHLRVGPCPAVDDQHKNEFDGIF